MNQTTTSKKKSDEWLENLKHLVQKKPLVVFQFDREEWARLRESRRGANEFTIARSHALFEKVRVPTACLVVGKDDDGSEVYFGLASSRSAVTTLESRIKVKRALRIQPSSKAGILKLVTEKTHARNLAGDRLSSRASVIALSPKLSVHLVEKLAEIESNRGAMRAVVASLSAPKYYRGMDAMQEDAVHAALRAFGLSPGDQAVSLELARGQNTALARVNIMEDSVIEHDARTFPGYELIDSDITGRAVFEKGRERLEVFTANRRPLEKVFGVDLLYLNTTRQNIVMVQYKMLEPHKRKDHDNDWVCPAASASSASRAGMSSGLTRPWISLSSPSLPMVAILFQRPLGGQRLHRSQPPAAGDHRIAPGAIRAGSHGTGNQVLQQTVGCDRGLELGEGRSVGRRLAHIAGREFELGQRDVADIAFGHVGLRDCVNAEPGGDTLFGIRP